MRTRVKICGITNLEDALAACEFGADAIGFVFAKSPRQISAEAAGDIADHLPPFTKTVGVFTNDDQEVIRAADWVPLDLIQLHGEQSDHFADLIGAGRVIRAIRIRDEESLKQFERWKSGAAYLLDTWASDKMGGTGGTFNWEIAKKAKDYGKPVILAGGLTPENVADAIRAVRPYAVDVSSGVEISPGKKDIRKIKEFIDNVRSADENA
ncbi:MAG TPA: phosphoribosylanthranilate isomerase [Armatimonadota bacterium]|nr:phosphoribosylanthranilate isomerase [Armatimonadota bacterium]